ncbi:TPA: glycosyltransferase family 4 protein [Clostridium perfringens]
MKIGIDARPLIEKKTGIGYYLFYLLENILKNDKENEYYLFSDRKIYFDYSKYDNLIIIEDIDSKLKKTAWYLLKCNKLCKKYKIDVFWGTQHVLPLRLKNIKKLLTVHDLVAFDFKETMSIYNRVINKLLIPNSLKKADKLVAVSNSTKERINYNFPEIEEKKIKVIYEDVVIKNISKNFDYKILKKSGLESKKYLMFLGTIEPRKNIKTLIKAFLDINRETKMKLVICGKYGWKCEEERGLIERNKDKIVFLNYVTEDEKNYLMKNTFALIFPSLYEGFGLPVLETIRNGSIALVANNTSLKELIEEDFLRFETKNDLDLFNKVINLYKDEKLYRRALEYCNKREKFFSWDNISKEYIELFNNL